MAEPKTKKLDIEDKLGSVEQKKDFEALKEITDNLPSSAKVRIYRTNEEGVKKFISTYAASDFDSNNPHEWIKSKFYAKHGGGEYRVELVDSEGKSVGGSTIDLIEEEGKENSSSKHIEIMDKALDMKERASEKMIEANTEMHKVEKAKVESTMELMGRQWDAMAKIYESRIEDISNKKDGTADPMLQMFFQREIENMKREMERDKERFMSEIKSKEESRSGSDKVVDLLTTMLLNKKEENPIDNIAKTMELVTQMTGNGGDTLDDIMSNPIKLKMYKEMMGVEDKKKDFMEDMMSNPMKMEMFKKMFGIEDKKKDFMEDMMSDPMKMEVFKKMFGIEEKKKDLITEVMENPEKFKMVQRMLGLPTAEEMASRNSAPPIIPEPKKDFLEQMMDMTSKLVAAKPVLTNMLGIESRPIANIMELAGNVINGAMPHIVDGVKTVSNNMVTVELLKRGYVQGANGTLIPLPSNKQKQNAHRQEVQHNELPVVQARPIVEPIIERPKQEDGMGLEQKFEKMLAGIVVESGEGIEATALVDKMSDLMVAEFKSNPMIIMQVIKYGDKLDAMMGGIINKIVGTDNEVSLSLAREISRVTREKAGA